MDREKIPKFLEGEFLPPGYFDPPDPYADAPTRKLDIGKLVAYAKIHGKTQWDLTKDELERFEEDGRE